MQGPTEGVTYMFSERRNLFYLCAIVSCIFVLIIILAMNNLVSGDSDKKAKERHWKEVENAVTAINDQKLDIMYFGGLVDKPYNLDIRRIYGFDEESVFGSAAKNNVNGKLIIIYDPTDEVNMSLDQWVQLKTLVDERGISYVYIGTKQIQNMIQAGLISVLDPSKPYNFVYHRDGDAGAIGTIGKDITQLGKTVLEEIDPYQRPFYELLMVLADPKSVTVS